jgi:phage terminase large subunit
MSLSASIAKRLEIRRRIGEDRYLQALEMARCAQDVCFFVNRWLWTYDPRRRPSTLPFDLFPRQEEFLRWLKDREDEQEDGLAEKSRDVGFTWLCTAYDIHAWLFRDGYAAGYGSRKLDLVDVIGNMDTIFEKMRFALRNLPNWMLPAGFQFGKHDGYCKIINPASGSSITGEGGDNIGRGGRKSRYTVDEAAFLEHPELVDAALSQNTRCRIDVSTPNGMGNSFYRRRHSGMVPVFTFHWRDDPRKDDAWYEREKRRIQDPVIVAQELDIDYTASIEGIVIPAKWVRAAVNLELPKSGKPIAGLDIADEGRNKNVLVVRSGPVVTDILDWNQMNTTQTAHKAADEAEKRGVSVIHYDSDGVGAGVKGTFQSTERTLNFSMDALSGGAAPTETRWPDGRTSKERFLNYRAEMWWILRTRFEKTFEYVAQGIEHPRDEMISIPDHTTLISQLSMPLCMTTESGKVKIESKPDMRKRGIESPDFADALAYAFAPPHVSDETVYLPTGILSRLNRPTR